VKVRYAERRLHHLHRSYCVQFRHRTAASQPKRPDRVDLQMLVQQPRGCQQTQHPIHGGAVCFSRIIELHARRLRNRVLDDRAIISFGCAVSTRHNNSCQVALTAPSAPKSTSAPPSPPPPPRRVGHQHQLHRPQWKNTLAVNRQHQPSTTQQQTKIRAGRKNAC
jgi:hypothetical protein